MDLSGKSVWQINHMLRTRIDSELAARDLLREYSEHTNKQYKLTYRLSGDGTTRLQIIEE